VDWSVGGVRVKASFEIMVFKGNIAWTIGRINVTLWKVAILLGFIRV